MAETVLLAGLVAAAAGVMVLGLGTYGGRVATQACVNLCAVLSFALYSGTTGIVSFGHAGFMGVGAYLSGILTMPASLQATVLPALPTWLAGHELPLVLALGAVAAAGLALALVTGLPIARLGGASAAIATLGFLVIVTTVLTGARDFTRGAQTFFGVPRLTDLPVALAAAVAFIALARWFKESRVGLMLRAARDNEIAAVACGVDVRRLRLVAWALSGMAAAVAGALYGHMLGAFSPRDFSFALTFGLIAMLIVGGMATVSGAVGGVALVSAVIEVLRQLEDGFALGPLAVPQIFGLPVVGVSLAILLVVWRRPDGLFGRAELPAPIPLAARASPHDPPPLPSEPVDLVVEDVGKSFAGVTALAGVSLVAEGGRITGLIGPNGAGKSTLVNVVTGQAAASRGSARLGAARLDGAAPHRLARLGVARTFQNIRMFDRLTLEENVRVAAYAMGRGQSEARSIAAAELAEMGLTELAHRPASTLPYGARRRLEIARALALRPRFLLLDEPAAGMNPEETTDLAARIARVRDRRGLGILLIDHDLRFVTGLSDRIVVLDRGTVIAAGSPAQIVREPKVVEAYIGSHNPQPEPAGEQDAR